MGETRDMAHAAEMVRVLKEKYTNLSFTGHGDALGKVIYPKYYKDSNEFCTFAGLGPSVYRVLSTLRLKF